MKFVSILLLTGTAALAGCSTTANNTTNANIRGTNTNTGYVTNSETNVKPTMPANVTNISPPAITTNSNSNVNKSNTNSRNTNTNANRKP